MGRCPDCGGWSTVEEVRLAPVAEAAERWVARSEYGAPVPMTEIEGGSELRFSSSIEELDRVLGGGIVEGSAVLVGGDPGIGKSTLLLQMLIELGKRGMKVLYVSGEESARQIRMRADRLGGAVAEVLVLSEIDVDAILAILEKDRPSAVVIDSVQTIVSAGISGAPGTVSQVREVSARLVGWAKGRGLPLFLVGHVTKDGSLAGPRVLEHMVDTVLYFEGDKGHPFRILRAVKNRFGSTNEVGVFEMGEGGLRGVLNPSSLFIAERPEGASGSAVVPCLEGTRVLLVEIQALVAPQTFGTAQRTVSGVERSRVQILSALLDRRLGLSLCGQDIFVSVAGGLEVSEPAGDLGLVAAILSSYTNRPLPQDAVFFGEVGLAGEVRGVSRAEDRVREALKLGFKKMILPARQSRELSKSPAAKGAELHPIGNLDELMELLA
jgi:DNA repair protein RadA/Sms